VIELGLEENILPPDEIVEAGLGGNLVIFVGAGASMLRGLPDWNGLAAMSLETLRQQGVLDYSEVEQLKSQDAKKQLSIADLLARENSIDLDLGQHLDASKEGDIYKHINNIGCPCVTTNYDELLEPRDIETADDNSTGADVRRIYRREDFFAANMDEPRTVLHLHGVRSKPETMIVTTKDYLDHYEDSNVQRFLRSLFERKTVLFLGYGLEESEILEYIFRKGVARETSHRKRFALMPFFRNQNFLFKKLHMYYEKSFGVHLLGYIRDNQDYKCLESVMEQWSGALEIGAPGLDSDYALMNEVLNDG
jgi:hypothetical protein